MRVKTCKTPFTALTCSGVSFCLLCSQKCSQAAHVHGEHIRDTAAEPPWQPRCKGLSDLFGLWALQGYQQKATSDQCRQRGCIPLSPTWRYGAAQRKGGHDSADCGRDAQGASGAQFYFNHAVWTKCAMCLQARALQRTTQCCTATQCCAAGGRSTPHALRRRR